MHYSLHCTLKCSPLWSSKESHFVRSGILGDFFKAVLGTRECKPAKFTGEMREEGTHKQPQQAAGGGGTGHMMYYLHLQKH